MLVLVIVGVAGCVDAQDTASIDADVRAGSMPEKAEIKVVLADASFNPRTLGGAEPERRDVFFYDKPSLAHYKDGVLFRSRRVSGGDDDVTVKLRPMTPTKIDPSFRDEDGFKCELDVSAGTAGTSSCSLSFDVAGSAITAAAESPRRIGDLWKDKARRFAEQVTPDIDLEDLRAFGPIASTVWKIDAKDIGEITFELWDVPGGDKTLEASVKVRTADLREKERALLSWLERRHLERARTQKTKTAAALEALSKHD